MANLGDNNTPVEGESFGLPSGYSFDEENGDLVIRDTDGTVAMRRADGAAWQLEGSDISGVGAFDSESVNTEVFGIGSKTVEETTTVSLSDVSEVAEAHDINSNKGQYVTIELTQFRDNSGQAELWAGFASGTETEFQLTDDGGNTITDTNPDPLVKLIDAGNNSHRFVGKWTYIFVQDQQFGVFGDGFTGQRPDSGTFQVLNRGGTLSSHDDVDFIIETRNEGEETIKCEYRIETGVFF